MLQWLSAIGSIVLIDLVLSGDNALVIGAAAAGLERRRRLFAIAIGGGGAIVLRILFAVIATLLLRLPLIQAIGAIVLLYIAIRLLLNRSKERREAAGAADQVGELVEEKKKAEEKNFLSVLATIVMADVTMSLDNILAVGAIAWGELLLLVVGLLLSIGLLLIGSALIAELIARLPWLLDVASLVLAWTASHMLLDDIHLGPMFDSQPWTQIAVPAIAVSIVLLADFYLWRRDRS
ncbi:MAG: YjbE family putative metal transport protein [Ktedonobacteraceae bacterium]|nr:YjbE family putative metal transport protein [Ktedonobacteraceae bacterium]